MRLYLFGFLSDDFYGRVLVTPAEQTVAALAAQLMAWGPSPGYTGPVTVSNEAGDILDPTLSITDSGLGNGDIFTVTGGA